MAIDDYGSCYPSVMVIGRLGRAMPPRSVSSSSHALTSFRAHRTAQRRPRSAAAVAACSRSRRGDVSGWSRSRCRPRPLRLDPDRPGRVRPAPRRRLGQCRAGRRVHLERFGLERGDGRLGRLCEADRRQGLHGDAEGDQCRRRPHRRYVHHGAAVRRATTCSTAGRCGPSPTARVTPPECGWGRVASRPSVSHGRKAARAPGSAGHAALQRFPGAQVRGELQVTGTSPVVITARAWKVGSATPNWQLSYSDSAASRIQSRGAVATWSYLQSANADRRDQH